MDMLQDNLDQRSLLVLDNGGETADRYTVWFNGGVMATGITMSADPTFPTGVGMINQYSTGRRADIAAEEVITYEQLPESCKSFIRRTLGEYIPGLLDDGDEHADKVIQKIENEDIVVLDAEVSVTDVADDASTYLPAMGHIQLSEWIQKGWIDSDGFSLTSEGKKQIERDRRQMRDNACDLLNEYFFAATQENLSDREIVPGVKALVDTSDHTQLFRLVEANGMLLSPRHLNLLGDKGAEILFDGVSSIGRHFIDIEVRVADKAQLIEMPEEVMATIESACPCPQPGTQKPQSR